MPEEQRSSTVCEECGESLDSEVLICPHCGDKQRLMRQLARTRDTKEPQPRSWHDYIAREERGRVSLLLYGGAGMIAISGFLSAVHVYCLINDRTTPLFVAYADSILIIGIALVIVGFARQAKRMC